MSATNPPAPVRAEAREKNWIESEISDDQFEVKVTVTLGFQHHGDYPGIRDDIEQFYRALHQQGELPDGTLWYGHEARVCDAKALRKRARKLAKEDAERATSHPIRGRSDG